MDNSLRMHENAEVTLGGKIWRVPVLNARQNRIIDPLILTLIPVFSTWGKEPPYMPQALSAQQYDALLEIAFVAISREHGEWTRERFLDLPVTLPELVAAFGVIARQTGIFTQAGEDAPGERAGE